MRRLLLLLSISLLGVAACQRAPHRAPGQCSFKGGRVKKDLTLYKVCSPYAIKGGIDVLENVTLTIEAGTEVRFKDGDWLEISAAGTKNGRLVAKGTADEPIVLTSADPGRASARTWLGLWFAAGTRDSIVTHMTIRAAGGHNTYLKPTLVQGCLTITDVAPGALVLEDVRLEGCVDAGVVLRKSRPVLTRLSLHDMATGFWLDGVEPAFVPSDVHFERVATPVLEGNSTL